MENTEKQDTLYFHKEYQCLIIIHYIIILSRKRTIWINRSDLFLIIFLREAGVCGGSLAAQYSGGPMSLKKIILNR